MSKAPIELPRPWYLAVTALWSSAAGFPALRDTLVARLGVEGTLAAQHVLVPSSRWHSTVFAIARANGVLDPSSAEEQVLELLRRLATQPLVEQIRAAFTPFELEAYELAGYDSSISVQFRTAEAMALFRARLHDILDAPIRALLESWNDTPAARAWQQSHKVPLVESLLAEPVKNAGQKLFGSVARAASASEAAILRWQQPIGPFKLHFDRVYLVASDDALCNPLALDEAIVIQR